RLAQRAWARTGAGRTWPRCSRRRTGCARRPQRALGPTRGDGLPERPITVERDVAAERAHERIARWLYTLAWLPATPLALAYLAWRARRQPAYLERIGERLGRHPRRNDDAPLIWIHAVSVGETRAAQPLVRALL